MSNNNNPSTPVKIPPSAAGYTPATLDPELRSSINGILIKEGHVAKIQEILLHTLHANPTNWPTLVENHARDLLRSGEVTTFPVLLKRVMDDIRHDTALAPSNRAANGTPGQGEEVNVNGKNVNVNGNGIKVGGGGRGENGNSLALPQQVVEDALKVTREALEGVVEIEEGNP
ncbi:hypothetical protein QC761_705600 [Podospora bellae-mahoneyi]|uniref:Uncharacterized protein n=1 Tax=Podospora bellae-mahoneyi TaxID=2093777 RepID=A0ABR0F5E4_9PEZI|nr:hypothetical protein QC761_705600 [Podospora bellae-mahoneyi]